MKRIVACIVLVAFIFSGGFGFLHALGMQSSAATAMPAMHMETISPCPFMNMVKTECDMTVLDHIAFWQHTFTSLLVGMSLLLSVIIGILLLIVRYDVMRMSRSVLRSFVHTRWRADTRSFFTLLFSKGILNPKLF